MRTCPVPTTIPNSRFEICQILTNTISTVGIRRLPQQMATSQTLSLLTSHALSLGPTFGIHRHGMGITYWKGNRGGRHYAYPVGASTTLEGAVAIRDSYERKLKTGEKQSY